MTKIDLGSHRARCAYSPFGNRSPTIIRWERGYPRVVETDYHIIHGMAVALLLNRDADHNARLACRALVPKQMREVIGDDRVFVGEARTACQLGGGRFLFKCVGQGAPSHESILWIGHCVARARWCGGFERDGCENGATSFLTIHGIRFMA